MALTDVQVRAAKPAERGYKLADAGGLHLFVTPNGVRSWRWRYEVAGRERILVLGRYPDMGVAGARRARDDARVRLRAGDLRNKAPARPTLEQAARAWHALNKPRWKPHHAADVLHGLAASVFPAIGAEPVDQVTAPMVLDVLRPIEERGAVDTARRIKQRLVAVFGYALSQGWAASNPAAGIDAALAPLPPKGRRPAVTTLEEARTVLAAVEALSGQPVTKLAHRFLALTAARPGDVGGMRWDELHGLGLAGPDALRPGGPDLEGAEPTWRIPPIRRKLKREHVRVSGEHVVPLQPGAVEVLKAVHGLTGKGAMVFPNLLDATLPMSPTALSHLLLRAGYRDRHVPHGWRAAFSTIMNGLFPADRAVIDLMLAHAPKDQVERAYNRAEHLERRGQLARSWAEMLLDGATFAEDLLDAPRRR